MSNSKDTVTLPALPESQCYVMVARQIAVPAGKKHGAFVIDHDKIHLSNQPEYFAGARRFPINAAKDSTTPSEGTKAALDYLNALYAGPITFGKGGGSLSVEQIVARQYVGDKIILLLGTIGVKITRAEANKRVVSSPKAGFENMAEEIAAHYVALGKHSYTASKILDHPVHGWTALSAEIDSEVARRREVALAVPDLSTLADDDDEEQAA